MTAPAPLADGLAYPVASALRDCLRAEAGRSLMGAVCCALVRFGPTAAPLDRCDCGCDDGRGAAFVRVAGITTQPIVGMTSGRQSTGGNCAGPWVVTFDLGISRCVPLSADGAPLPCADDDALSVQLLADAAAVRRAVRCCRLIADRPTEWVSWTPARQGGCAGGWATIRVTLPSG